MSAPKPVYIGIDKATPGGDEQAVMICQKEGRRIVCRAVIREGALQDAIIDLALGNQHVWTLAELDAVISELEACRLPVREWLARLKR